MIALTLALAASPAPAGAGHCAGIAIVSAIDTGAGVRRGVATGTPGCAVDATNESLWTGYIPAAVPHLIVTVEKRGSFALNAPRSGTLVLGGAPAVRLSFVDNGSRWESESVPNTGGTATATAIATDGTTLAVTYHAVP